VAIDCNRTVEVRSGPIQATTNNRMELQAPTEALTWLHDNHGPCDVWICSDSEYVVLGCRDKSRSRKKNTKYWKRLDEAIKMHKTVEWSHVRGHSNNEYNNLADKLAGNARRKAIKNVPQP
jgi:ribonuclease HI